jgi:hypothetical protein
MGTGGATALGSPEIRAGLALEPRLAVSLLLQRRKAPTRISGDWRPPQRTSYNSIFKEQLSAFYHELICRFAGIYIQVFGKFRGQRPRLQHLSFVLF